MIALRMEEDRGEKKKRRRRRRRKRQGPVLAEEPGIIRAGK